MKSSMRHESTLPSFCSDMSSQQQLGSGSANPVEGDLHADLQNSHIQAPVNPAQQAVPKQEGDIPLAQALTGRTTVKYYLDALGLASGERAGGKHSFPDPDVHDLYSRVTLFVTTSTLPTELSGLRLAIGQPGFLMDESESFMSRFGYIWGDDGRRSAKNDLNISKPEDKAT
ncbi:hypothetical protein J4E91_008119 [Alternaria rosae]|nr:hypothetical protein J4E91_008119 [Alternaria rosae]